MAIISWNKEYGETLKVTLERFRLVNPKYTDAKITYAGRLDPMAEGLLLLLTDEDVHKKETFLNFDKVYEVEFILGVATDTYDILGTVTSTSHKANSEKELQKGLEGLALIKEQEYPPYSSKPVEGKPLWQWQREGSIQRINIPKKSVQIHKLTNNDYQEVPTHTLHRKILESIQLVEGDFRQLDIIKSWEKYFKQHQEASIKVYSLTIHASSGTYMRGLIHSLGKSLGTGACTLKIRRIQIGSYPLIV